MQVSTVGNKLLARLLHSFQPADIVSAPSAVRDRACWPQVLVVLGVTMNSRPAIFSDCCDLLSKSNYFGEGLPIRDGI